jgi:hypothetical protein
MIKADNTQKQCFVSCDEQTRKDGRCTCIANKNQALQLLQPDVIKSLPDFELQFCSNCFQMTNHLDNKCQKCEGNVL